MLEGIINKLDKLKKSAKLALGVGLLSSVFHIVDPMLFPRIWYMIKDPFTSTQTEERIERQFGIDYEGTEDEKRQNELEYQLLMVKIQNPKLLRHCSKIVLHGRDVLDSPLVKPFLYFSGRAFPIVDTVELCSTDLSTVAHELAHIKHFNTPSEFDKRLDRIINPDNYGNGLKPDWHFFINMPSLWSDGKHEPRKGFVKPYGAISRHENVATYVEKIYDSRFWEDDSALQTSNAYPKVVDLLKEYGFISKKQFEEINHKLKSNNPQYLYVLLDKELKRLQKPRLLKRENYDFSTSEILYEDSKMEVSYATGMGFTGLGLTLEVTSGHKKTFLFEWDDKKELQPWGINFEKNPELAKVYEKIKTRFKELGYDKLGISDNYVAMLHPEWKR